MKKLSFRSIVLFLLLIPLLMFSSEVTEGARQGLLLWYNSVVPALFPFMVLSGLIVSGGGISQIMTPFYWVLHPVLGLSREGCYVLVSGLLCGYPMGAKTCAEFVNDGRISITEGKYLMAICNHPSPMFILGYMYPWFAERISIRTLLLSIYAPILFIAIVAKQVYPFEFERESSNEPLQNNASTSSADEAILSSTEVLCKIGGYLVLFSIAIVFIRKLTIIPGQIKLCFIGIMEMTTGIREFGELTDWKIGYIASVAALTFGGFSGIFQTKSVLGNKKKAGLSIRPYIFWKTAHAILSVGLAYLLCNKN